LLTATGACGGVWLPIVNPPFHDSFGRLLARNSFAPYGIVATAIRVSPPHGKEIPSTETNPDLVLEAVIVLHYAPSLRALLLQPPDPGRMLNFDQTFGYRGCDRAAEETIDTIEVAEKFVK
jgi:hypothetical protein